MKKKNGFEMLENAEDNIVEHLSSVPVLGKDEKERMLRMSIKKYKGKDTEGADEITGNDGVSEKDDREQEVKTVEFRRKPDWIFILSAAACFAVVTGIFGLRFFKDKGDMDDIYAGNTVTTIAETSEPGMSAEITDTETSAVAVTSVITESTYVSYSTVSESDAALKETVTEEQVTPAETTVTLPEETTVTDEVVTTKPDPWKEDPEAYAEELYKDEIVRVMSEYGNNISELKYSLYNLYAPSGTDEPDVKELIFYYGTCSADTTGYIYTVRNGELIQFDKTAGGGHTIFYEDLNDGCLVAEESWMAVTILTWYRFEGDELVTVKEEEFETMYMSADEQKEKLESYNLREIVFAGYYMGDNTSHEWLRDDIDFNA
ncbi:MAG: hypothetical protein ILP22_12365 [Oscillospiraceae bacterium]|nr:hypothetical protein [Oscillospiraceae bacterium]